MLHLAISCTDTKVIKSQKFIFYLQVAVDGLRRLLGAPCVWDNLLSSNERKETLVQLMNLLQHFASSELRNDIIVANLLETINSANILKTVLEVPDMLCRLLVVLLDLLPPLSSLGM